MQRRRLDDIRIEPRRLWLAGVKALFKGDADLAARWRALKKLAVAAHDHDREQLFFKGELRARRWATDKPWHAVFWFGLLYGWLSDFGRSLVRPIVWLVLLWLVFAGLYLGTHLTGSTPSVAGFAWGAERLTAAAGRAPPALRCRAGPGDAWGAARLFALRTGQPLPSFASGGKLDEALACLFGVQGQAPGHLNALPLRFRPNVPNGIVYLGLLHQILSAVLIFLLLLALRNHFRIK